MGASNQKQLNIRSDDAHRTAHAIAERLGVPVTEAVTRALKDFAGRLPDAGALSTGQLTEVEAMRLLAAKYQAVAQKSPPSPADHDWLYDEHGLPK